MSHGYKFYIQRVEKVQDGTYSPVASTLIDLEQRFEGLKYSRLTGLTDIGKAKNIYTEKYADGDKLRVYIPQTIQSEATSMTLTIYFFGKDRQSVFADFANEIKSGIHRYWDTARNLWFDFYIEDELKPTDENWYKGEPYFKVEVKMKNIYGQCFSRINTNILVDGERMSNVNTYLLGTYAFGDIRPQDGETVSLSFSGYLGTGHERFRIYNSGGMVPLATFTIADYNFNTKRYEKTFDWVVGSSDNTSINIYQADKDGNRIDTGDYENPNRTASKVEDIKLEIIKTK